MCVSAGVRSIDVLFRGVSRDYKGSQFECVAITRTKKITEMSRYISVLEKTKICLALFQIIRWNKSMYVLYEDNH